MLRFQLLGDFQVTADDGTIRPVGSPKVAQTLALLLTHANEFVSSETLIRELWGSAPPRSALNTVQTYIHHARRFLASEPGVPGAGAPSLATRPGGYLLHVSEEVVDHKVFEAHRLRGAAALRAGEHEAAAAHLGAAGTLWRGHPLSNTTTGPVLKSRVAHLEDRRIQVLEMSLEARAALGQHRDTVPELRVLVHDYPLHEGFHGHLITALHLSGRRAEALEAYRHARGVLRAELGLEPSALVQRAHERVLASGGRVTAPGPTPATGRLTEAVPAQRNGPLPARGRSGEALSAPRATVTAMTGPRRGPRPFVVPRGGVRTPPPQPAHGS
ncbi:AfsR/SARP family transcriptional regulator [Streptomyces sp. BI20]|uniref:AfsR/SARP family transcriptional regulator n=1 Tax=Streptomyces sp. BI20 TaxID=3403460 RepID=UPI003C74AC1C